MTEPTPGAGPTDDEPTAEIPTVVRPPDDASPAETVPTETVPTETAGPATTALPVTTVEPHPVAATSPPPTAPQPTTPPATPPADAPPVVEARTSTEQRPVRRPLGALPAVVPGVVLAVVAIGLGVVGVHDAIVIWGRSDTWDPFGLTGQTWTGSVIGWVADLTPQTWMTVAGVALALVGVWLVVLAVKPRRIRGAAIASSTGMWIEDSGVARLSTATALQVAGVESVKTAASRRAVSLKVRAGRNVDSPSLATSVRDAVTEQLRPLARTPKITVSVTQPDEPTTGGTS